MEKRTDGSLPYWRIRLMVETPSGLKRTNYHCGYVRDGLQAAKKRRLELLAQVNSGGLRSYAGSTTVADLADKFLAMRGSTVAHATRLIYQQQIGKHIVPALGSMGVATIKRLHIEQLLAEQGKTLSWWSVDQTLRTLRTMFAAAVEWGMAEHNPAAGVRHGRKQAKHAKVILSPAAFQQLMDALDQRTAAMVWILASTGLRISELIGLKWTDIDLDRAVLFVSRKWYRGDLGDCKTPKSRRVCYLNPTAIELLRALPRTAGFIFSDDDGITPINERHHLRHHVRSVLRQLGLYTPGSGWHSFRRLFVSLSQAAGASSIEAAMLVGHTSTSMTTDYTILQPERALALATGVGQRLLPGPVGEPPRPDFSVRCARG